MAFDDLSREALDKEAAEIVANIIDRAKNATKMVRSETPCEKCGCKHIRKAEVEDTRAMLEAAEFLANRGFGRPAAKADEEEAKGVMFVRKIVYEGGEDVAATEEA